jgi:hypothetical protein
MLFTFTNFHNETIISINEVTLRLLASCAKLRNNMAKPSIYTLQTLLGKFCLILNTKTLSEIVLSKELQNTLTSQFNQNVFISF